MPKTHYIHHGALDILNTAQRSTFVINPLAFSNQTQEDFVGRAARISRRVAVPLVHLRVIQRCLICAYQSILDADHDRRGLR